MICIPISEPDTERTLVSLKKAAEVADLVELRLDSMVEYDLVRLLENRSCPLIVTNRPVREGGSFSGDEEKRISILKGAIELEADYVDIEHDSVHLIKDRRKTKLILSYHNFQETPRDLMRIHAQLNEAGADIAKVAVRAHEAVDNLVVFDVLRSSVIPTIGLCMGEAGLMSRVLAPKFGAFLTFASLSKGAESAPGQITAREMKDIYHYNTIKANSKIYGLIGDSPNDSPLIPTLNSAFHEADLNARFLPFPGTTDLKKTMRAFKAIEVEGYSVLPPYQEAALAAVDMLHPSAEKVGRVDTIVNQNGRLQGHAICHRGFRMQDAEYSKEFLSLGFLNPES